MQHYENVTVGSNPVRVLRKNIEKSLPARQPQEMSTEGRVRLSYPVGFQQALVLREEVARGEPIHLWLGVARDQPSPGFGLAGTPATQL